MPQLDPSVFLPQAFWLISVFLLFWLIMDKIIIPKIEENIEARKRKYNDLILKAEQINKKAKKSLEKYNEAITVAKEKAFEQIKQSEKELQDYITQKEQELNIEIDNKLEMCEKQLLQEQAEVMSKVNDISKNIALTTLQYLEIKNISTNDIDDILKLEDKKDVI